MEFLITQGLTNPDGTVKKKGTTPGKVVNAEGKALEVKMDATYAQKVNGMLSPQDHQCSFFIPYVDRMQEEPLPMAN